MVDLLFAPDHSFLTQPRHRPHPLRSRLRHRGHAERRRGILAKLNPEATLELFGQDWNEQAYAVCGSDMLIKGQNIENIKFGSSFTEDGFPTRSSTTCSPTLPSA